MVSPPTPTDNLNALFDMEGDVSTESNPLNLREKRDREEHDMAGSFASSQRCRSDRNPGMKLGFVRKPDAPIEAVAEDVERDDKDDDQEGILTGIPIRNASAFRPVFHIVPNYALTLIIPPRDYDVYYPVKVSVVLLVFSFPALTSTKIQDPSLANSPIDSPIDSSIDSPIDSPIQHSDIDAGAGTGVLPEYDQPVVTIPSTQGGLSSSLLIPFLALVPARPTINETLARAAKAHGTSVQAPK
ncbi:hypothetical protein LWI29_002353 [Acer saccharum]|uniref:Uncharacterized protein n=1 Tax=Acer saccharum TaxID=4024 RepID=A0AA39RVM8_ACESA|nr:hypothetical protein LWI29_002353 [Acer saccharum]